MKRLVAIIGLLSLAGCVVAPDPYYAGPGPGPYYAPPPPPAYYAAPPVYVGGFYYGHGWNHHCWRC